MTAAPTVVPVDGAMKDFSTHRKPVSFTIDGDVFTGPAEIAAELLIDYGVKFAKGQTEDNRTQLDDLKDLMSIFLWEDDYNRLVARLADKRNPIGLEQLDQICDWLTEYHGMRPTQPPPDSSSPSSNPASGTDMTATVPTEDSTPDSSALLDSSTTFTSTSEVA